MLNLCSYYLAYWWPEVLITSPCKEPRHEQTSYGLQLSGACRTHTKRFMVRHVVRHHTQHRFRQWFVACSAPSRHLSLYWLIGNWTMYVQFESKYQTLPSGNWIWKCLQNGGYPMQASVCQMPWLSTWEFIMHHATKWSWSYSYGQAHVVPNSCNANVTL